VAHDLHRRPLSKGGQQDPHPILTIRPLNDRQLAREGAASDPDFLPGSLAAPSSDAGEWGSAGRPTGSSNLTTCDLREDVRRFFDQIKEHHGA